MLDERGKIAILAVDNRQGGHLTDTPTPAPTPRPKAPKPEKPFPDFPLFWHSRGYWAVKRDGRQIPYGADWKAAYNAFLRDEDAREKGEARPSAPMKSYTLADAINLMMTRQESREGEGVIKPRQFLRYREYLEFAVTVIPKTTRLIEFTGPRAPELFGKLRRVFLARGLYPARDGIGMIRACLDYAARKRLMPAPDYGEEFDKPAAATLRKAKQATAEKDGERAWTVEQLRAILADAEKHGPPLLAFVLLGLNCAFGGTDVARLPDTAVDRASRLIRFPRPKTGIPRVCPLWDRTLAAIDAARAIRPDPRDPADGRLVFLTNTGRPYVHVDVHKDEKGTKRFVRVDAVNHMFRRCLRRAGATRKGAGFYTLRAMARVLMMGSGADAALVSTIMGHGHANPMDAAYVRGDFVEKLRAVVAHIETQLFTTP